MANKRELKRGISYICSELLAECVAFSLYGSKSDTHNMNEISTELARTIMRTHSDYIMRISHPEPGIPAKKYYNILINNFNTEVNDIIDQINNLH